MPAPDIKMSSVTKPQAILLLTDKDSPVIQAQYEAIKHASQNHADVLIAYHQKDGEKPPYNEKAKLFVFTNSVLTDMGFRPISQYLTGTNQLIPGSNHFPLLQFYRDPPQHKYYWVIEDDVRFSGDWKLFFDAYENVESDFITCRIHSWKEQQDWYWWKLFHSHKVVPLEKRIGSFNPIYRISNKVENPV